MIKTFAWFRKILLLLCMFIYVQVIMEDMYTIAHLTSSTDSMVM